MKKILIALICALSFGVAKSQDLSASTFFPSEDRTVIATGIVVLDSIKQSEIAKE
jgi:hypothetical protein